MFRKNAKASNAHTISNKDVKKIKEKLIVKQGYTEEMAAYVLKDDNHPDDHELKVAKI